MQEHYKNSRFRIPIHVFLSQECVPTVHNLWNKYDYSYDYALSTVQQGIGEIQQFFHYKSKQIFYAYFTKIGILRRELRSLFELYKFPSGTTRESDIGIRKEFR